MLSQWWQEFLFLLERLTWASLLDILLVALIFYVVLTWLQNTQGMAILRGVLVVVFLVGFILSVINLPALNWLLRNLLPSLLVAIPVIFAPEIRQALERLGRLGFAPLWVRYYDKERIIHTLVQAVTHMSRNHIGALIVLERRTSLGEYAASGVLLDALPSPELLIQIFYPNTPLHDGAVLMRRGRVYAAACILPLPEHPIPTSSPEERLGLRHRAAIGITQRTDALAIVVSEETGSISLAQNGVLDRGLTPHQLRHRLEGQLVTPQSWDFPFLRRRRQRRSLTQNEDMAPPVKQMQRVWDNLVGTRPRSKEEK